MITFSRFARIVTMLTILAFAGGLIAEVMAAPVVKGHHDMGKGKGKRVR